MGAGGQRSVTAVMAAAAILIFPLWWAPLPAMPDLPAHLACFDLLMGAIKDPHLAHFYRIDWQFVPNLASEITVPFLAHLFGLVGATKLFLTASVALWVGGAAAVQRTLFGRAGMTSVLAAFFAYNANFFWGFLNYDFGAGLALALFALWIASARWPRAQRLAIFMAAVTILYFCHVFAAAVLLLLIGCFEGDRLLRDNALATRRAVATAAAIAALAAPSAFAFLVLKPHGADGGHLEFNLLSTWSDRLGAATLTRFDQANFVALAALAGFWCAGVWQGWLRIHPAMRSVLIVLAFGVVLAPEWAMGGWGVDLRLPAILGALAFAAVELRLALRWQSAVGAAGIAGLLYSAATAGGNWLYYDRQYAEFRAAIRDLPRGTRIMTALDGTAMGLASDEPYWHMAEFAIIDRQGVTPLLFTTAGQHVVRLQPAFEHYAASNAQQGSPPDIGELDDLAAGQIDGDKNIRDTFPYLLRFQCHYDAVAVIRSGGRPSPAPDSLSLRHRGSFFDLYAVKRDPACPAS